MGQTKRAEEVIQSENKKRQEHKGQYATSVEDYMNHKFSSVESVIAVMDAEACLKECQKGRDVIAKTLEQNLQEFYTNIQQCYKSQEKTGGSAHARQVNYPGVIGCLESNIAIMEAMEKRLSDDFVRMQDSLFR